MNMDYLPELLKGLGTTLELTLASLLPGWCWPSCSLWCLP